MTPAPILSVESLAKTVTLHLLAGKRVEALRGVSFSIEPGEFLAVVGPSGSGKSSLLKCIYRTYLPTGGAIRYRTEGGDRVDLATLDERAVIELRRREIRYVSQFLKAPPRVAALDVVAMPVVASGGDLAAARRRAAAILERLNIGAELASSYPSLFSGGEQQRVNVARALAQPARLMLLDEPTSALDAENRARVLELLREARAGGATIVGVFHDREVLDQLADRVIALEEGRIVQAGRLADVDLSRYLGAQASRAG